MSDFLISGKREFNYDEEEKFFLTFMRILFVISALILVWGVYSHLKQIDLIKTGNSAVGTVSLGRNSVSFVAEDGHTYYVNITGMLIEDFEETIMVYYRENPAAAVPPTSIKFFLFIYGIAAFGMGISLFFIRRTQKSIEKNSPVL